jgi:plastocyanin
LDNLYSPLMVMVPSGTTVRWVNKGFHHHTVTSAMGLWDSGPMGRGGEFTVTFDRRGTFRYCSRFHRKEMHGTVIVQ